MVCFFSVDFENCFEKKIQAIDSKVSFTEVFEAIKQIKAVKLTSGRDEIIFRTEFPDHAHLAFTALSLAPPPRILVHHKKESVVSRP